MKAFNFAEDVVSTEVTVTDGFHDGGVGIVNGVSFTTASLSTSQTKYYYNFWLILFYPKSWVSV